MRQCSICREYGHNKRTCIHKIKIVYLRDIQDPELDESILKKNVKKIEKNKKWYKRLYYRMLSLFH